MHVTYKDEKIGFSDQLNQWYWNKNWDVDLGEIKKLIDSTLTAKHKGTKAFMVYNAVGDTWFFIPVTVESPAGERQIKCKDDSTGDITHYFEDSLRAVTDRNNELIREIGEIQEQIKNLRFRRDELVERLEPLKLV